MQESFLFLGIAQEKFVEEKEKGLCVKLVKRVLCVPDINLRVSAIFTRSKPPAIFEALVLPAASLFSIQASRETKSFEIYFKLINYYSIKEFFFFFFIICIFHKRIETNYLNISLYHFENKYILFIYIYFLLAPLPKTPI